MSGTSLDAVDGVLLTITWPQTQNQRWELTQQAFASVPLPTPLAQELLALNTSGADELHRAALAANALMRLYARCVAQLCTHAHCPPHEVHVIGAHGQTVRHRPTLWDGTGYSLQLVNGALLAELTGISVACDLRSRDVAAGGQGAPLVPAFHQALWGDAHIATQGLAVLNLGGIANLSILRARTAPRGFDCGPANALLDAWCQHHTGQPFDADGHWAAQGHVLPELLAHLLNEPFVQQPPPKSTGRDLFNPAWLQARLCHSSHAAPVDVQATLTAYSAACAALHLQRHAPDIQHLLVSGGGVRNRFLMQQLAQRLPHVTVQSTQSCGIDPQAVEASAFAWLGCHTLLRKPLDLRAITGSHTARIPGCLYAA